MAEAPIQIVRTTRLNDKKYADKELICSDRTRRTLTESKGCTYDLSLARAVFVRDDLSGTELDNVAHAFTALSDKFGHNGKIEDVFEMFGQFEVGQRNVLFDDDGQQLVTRSNHVVDVDEDLYQRLHCSSVLSG